MDITNTEKRVGGSRQPSTSRPAQLADGSERDRRPSSILKHTNPTCTYAPRGTVFIPFPSLTAYLFVGEHDVEFPFLHVSMYVLQVSLDFGGGVLLHSLLSLRFNLPFFLSGSLATPEREEVGSKENRDELPDPRIWARWWEGLPGVDRVVWSRLDWE
jgi:hypothetical protein